MASPAVTYRAITSVVPMGTVATSGLFGAPPPRRVSPIDLFVENSRKINAIYSGLARDAAGWLPESGNLVLLGYMSAVESYFRALITGLINLDEATRLRAAPKQLSFGVATGHPDRSLLPEVLLENTSFASSRNVAAVLNEFLGVRERDLPNDVTLALAEFDKMCHVRHCCVHRFGKLGTRNAWELGFDSHRAAIERPFSPTIENVVEITSALSTFVRTMNNFLFYAILDRTVHDGFDSRISWRWTWAYASDRSRFGKYYQLFASVAAEPRSEPRAEVYRDFARAHQAMIAKRSR